MRLEGVDQQFRGFDRNPYLAAGETHEFNERIDTFDFDNALFRHLWDPQQPAPFFRYTRYYISDHRPLWAQFRTGGCRIDADRSMEPR